MRNHTRAVRVQRTPKARPKPKAARRPEIVQEQTNSMDENTYRLTDMFASADYTREGASTPLPASRTFTPQRNKAFIRLQRTHGNAHIQRMVRDRQNPYKAQNLNVLHVQRSSAAANPAVKMRTGGVGVQRWGFGSIWSGIKSAASSVGKFVKKGLKAVGGGLAWLAKKAFYGALSLAGVDTKKVKSFLSKAGGALMTIIKDPGKFIGTLVKALGQGFGQFSKNIGKHLKAGLMSWLFGTMSKAGIEMPKDFSIKSILGLVLQILDITPDALKMRITKRIGEKNMGRVEKAWNYISTFISEGVGGLWELVQEDLSNLKETIMGSIKNWLITQVVKSAITTIVSMFNPVSGLAKIFQMIYNVIKFLIERAQQIKSLFTAVAGSVAALAKGNVKAAANKIEMSLARLIPVAIGFLASILNISGIANTIKGIIKKIRQPIDKAINKVLNKIAKMFKGGVSKGKALAGKGLEKGKAAYAKGKAKVKAGVEKGKAVYVKGKKKVKKGIAKGKAAVGKIFEWWKAKKKFKIGKESHTLYIKGKGSNAELMMASNGSSVKSKAQNDEKIIVEIDKFEEFTKNFKKFKKNLDNEFKNKKITKKDMDDQLKKEKTNLESIMEEIIKVLTTKLGSLPFNVGYHKVEPDPIQNAGYKPEHGESHHVPQKVLVTAMGKNLKNVGKEFLVAGNELKGIKNKVRESKRLIEFGEKLEEVGKSGYLGTIDEEGTGLSAIWVPKPIHKQLLHKSKTYNEGEVKKELEKNEKKRTSITYLKTTKNEYTGAAQESTVTNKFTKFEELLNTDKKDVAKNMRANYKAIYDGALHVGILGVKSALGKKGGWETKLKKKAEISWGKYRDPDIL